jgi:hypothetical protein
MTAELLTVEVSRLKPGDKFIANKDVIPYMKAGQETEVTVLEPRQPFTSASARYKGCTWQYVCRREDTDKTGPVFFPKGQKLIITRGGTP